MWRSGSALPRVRRLVRCPRAGAPGPHSAAGLRLPVLRLDLVAQTVGRAVKTASGRPARSAFAFGLAAPARTALLRALDVGLGQVLARQELGRPVSVGPGARNVVRGRRERGGERERP